MNESDIKTFSDVIDLKMKEYISVVNSNQPTEKSLLISELSKKFDTGFKEVKTHLEKQDLEMAEFKKEVSPMLRAFNDSENTKIVWTRTGVTIKTTAGWIIVVGGALTILWGIIKYSAKSLIK